MPIYRNGFFNSSVNRTSSERAFGLGFRVMIMALALLAAGTMVSAATPPLKDYLKALFEAAESLDGNASAIFLSPGRDPSEKPTLAASLDELIRYMEDCEPFSLESAQRKPQAFTLGGTRNNWRGGMVVWRNDVFPVDFFVRKNGNWRTAGGSDVRRFLGNLQRQPWFEWNSQRTFTYRPTGAANRIFAQLRSVTGGSKGLRLFRGTTTYEALLFEFGQTLANRRPLDPKWRERLKSARDEIAAHFEKFYRAYEKGVAEKWATPAEVKEHREKWEVVVKRNESLNQKAASAKDESAIRDYLRNCLVGLLSQGEFCGLFTTPDPERAKLFSKGRVLDFAFEWGILKELQKAGRLYVGFEKMRDHSGEDVQVEIGFLGAGNDLNGTRWLADIIMSAFRSSKTEKNSELFN